MAIGVIKRPILTKLATRYNISQSGSPLVLGDTVLPVIDADDLVVSPKQQQTSSSATARTDTYTVPAGKVWYVKLIALYRDQTGSINFYKTVSGTDYDIAYVSGTSLTQICDLKLIEGEAIKTIANTGTSGAIRSNIFYLEEDVN